MKRSYNILIEREVPILWLWHMISQLYAACTSLNSLSWFVWQLQVEYDFPTDPKYFDYCN